MSRKIKFRAWDTVHKIMTYSDINCINFSGQILLNDGKFVNIDKTCYELMQHTGLKDKNGKKIYEGDICKHNDDIAKIIFWEGAFIFGKSCIHENALTNFACCKTFEVIGNIYENPELLNGGNNV